jgi:class 3 adenylate cyclase
MTPLVAVVGTALVWTAAFAVFIWAVRSRWMARYEAGFLAQVAIALVGVALMSASVVGVWGYFAARQILDQELVVEMQDVGRIVEAEIDSDLGDIEHQLKSLGASLADARDRSVSASDLQSRLDAAESFGTKYLQLRLFDPQGAVVGNSAGDSSAGEPVNRIGVAFNQEGKTFVSEAYYSQTFKREVLTLYMPIADANGKLRAMISARFDLASEFNRLIRQSTFNQSGYAVIVDGEGQIIAHPDVRHLDEDVAAHPAVQAARASRGVGSLVAKSPEGATKLYVYRALKNPSSISQQPWVLLTEVDRDEELAGLRQLRRELALGVALVLFSSILIGQQLSSSISDPLHRLGEFARRIGGGDLTARTAISGRDVSGRLSAALNDMATGLQERDHVKEVFGRYIATQVSDKLLKGEVNLGGEARRVTILFSDIRNFTGMSEAMAPQQVVAFLNDYFSEMVDAVFEHGGVLDKFMGDGLMAVFGSVGDETDHARHAVQAALRMKALLAKINGVRGMSGMPPIAIGIGIHTDEVVVGNIGSRKRLEYTVVGDGVNTTSRLQTLNKEFGTTILVSETTHEAIAADFECRRMPEAHLRGKTRNLQFYEVISAKSAAAPMGVM